MYPVMLEHIQVKIQMHPVMLEHILTQEVSVVITGIQNSVSITVLNRCYYVKLKDMSEWGGRPCVGRVSVVV